ncbi:GNAT family protein [Mammaliicoccus sp. Dog046]|uniref:GNAT family N-acetyltransferase n=1 Tax=Mammaliicoccus sp. Dog046 TaxID=3034233 RepID=UPI002B25FF9C|nr:GNAT family protein [Mammaliicoccus sp. Dog046]WQK85618.1 GNAT family protein [Mammaliicoccus sp. Dog046]
MDYNKYNQPIGKPLTDFKQPEFPNINLLEGRYSRLEKLNESHIDDLFKHFSDNEDIPNWTYLPYNHIKDYDQFENYINAYIQSTDPYFFAIVNKASGEAVGLLSLMRINLTDASIEVGHVHYSNVLKKTRIATEVHYLLAKYVFETLGFRRYEWKCDSLNEHSRKSAQRLGFTFEGTFRQHKIYKDRNRDTSWFSMLDAEWPTIKQGYESWLMPSNFDSNGEQKSKLSLENN